MNEIVTFNLENQEFPMDIIDRNGDRWIPSRQVGDALGTTRIRGLVRELKERGELKDKKHMCTLTVQMPGDTQPRKYSALSYRGVIRVAMRSEGKRAVSFRDWAEDVLYEVMTKGSYTSGKYAYVHEMDRRTKAINTELRAYKADEKFKRTVRTEARNIRMRKKTLDDLAGYPGLQDAVREVLETPDESLTADLAHANAFFEAVRNLYDSDREAAETFIDIRTRGNVLWVHVGSVVESADLDISQTELWQSLKGHPNFRWSRAHRFCGKSRKAWCFSAEGIISAD